MTNPTYPNLYRTMVALLREGSWRFSPLEDDSGVSMAVEGQNGNWICLALVREEEEQVIVYSFSPFKVPEDKRHEVAELITRANFDMVIGNFELDFDDGEVRYKTSLDVEGSELDSALLARLIEANWATLDRYLPALMAVVYSGFPPREAIEQVEGDLPPGEPS